MMACKRARLLDSDEALDGCGSGEPRQKAKIFCFIAKAEVGENLSGPLMCTISPDILLYGIWEFSLEKIAVVLKEAVGKNFVKICCNWLLVPTYNESTGASPMQPAPLALFTLSKTTLDHLSTEWFEATNLSHVVQFNIRDLDGHPLKEGTVKHLQLHFLLRRKA